jgi:hypothetical protein
MTQSQLTEHRPGPEEAVVALIQDEAQRNHGALPVRVLQHDKVRNSVTVELLIRLMINQQPKQLPPIPDVPIRWTSSTTHAVTVPLLPGSLGWITPAGGDISAWFAHGTAGAVDIEDQRFDLSDSIFEPGSRPFVDPLPAGALSDTDGVLYGPWQIGSSAASLAGALDTDPVNFTNGMLTWMGQVEGFINGIVPGTINPLSSLIPYVGEVEATATKLRSE